MNKKIAGLYYTDVVLDRRGNNITRMIFSNNCELVREANNYLRYLQNSSTSSYNSIKRIADDITYLYNYLLIKKKKLCDINNEDLNDFILFLMRLKIRDNGDVNKIKKNKYSIEKTLYTSIPFIDNYKNRKTIHLRNAVGLCDSSINRIFSRAVHYLTFMKECYDYEFCAEMQYLLTIKNQSIRYLINNGIAISKHKIKKVDSEMVFYEIELELLIGQANNKYERLLYFLLDKTGIRIGEALGLKINYYDLDNIRNFKGDIIYKDEKWYINIVWRPENEYFCRTKSHSSREIILKESEKYEFELLLERYLKFRDRKLKRKSSEWLFISTSGKQLTQNVAYKQFKRSIIKAGLSNRRALTLHSFRHTFATREINKGLSIEHLSKLLGHKSMKTTFDTYIHFLPEDIMEARNKYGKFMGVNISGKK